MMDQNLIDAYRWHRQQYPSYRATRAIEYARKDVAEGKKRYPHSAKHQYSGNWQSLESMSRYGSRAYYCDDWPDGWRNLGNVGEIRTESTYRGRYVDHNGWYTDDDYGETIAGYVLQLPARNGSPLYVPGTKQSDCDRVTLYPLDHYDDIGECARAADRYGELSAEQERDYQRAWRAGTEAAEKNQEAIELRREIITVCRDLRLARSTLRIRAPSDPWLSWQGAAIERLCGIARDKVQSLLTDLYKAREERDELRDNYGREAAFLEGFNG